MPRRSLLIKTLWMTTALLSSAPLVSAGEATPSASPAPIPALIGRYTAALNAHQPDSVAALYTEDAVVEQAVRGGNVFHGRDQIAGLIAGNLHGLPNLMVTTESAIAGDGQIAWAWVYDGTYTGQYPGLPAGHGQAIKLRGVSLLTIRDGLIAREVIYFDNYSFLVDTGALPATSASATSAS